MARGKPNTVTGKAPRKQLATKKARKSDPATGGAKQNAGKRTACKAPRKQRARKSAPATAAAGDVNESQLKGKGTRKPKKVRLLNIDERKQLQTSIKNEDLVAYVLKNVPSQLVSSLYPERNVFWQSLLPEKIVVLFESAATKLVTLYDECGKGSNKSSQLYLKWLEYKRSLVCKSRITEGAVVIGINDDGASEDTKRTVITLIMNTVYHGISQQMANEIEKISNPTCSTSQEDTRVSPSDVAAIHRICGWALKSVNDNFDKQSKQQSSEHLSDRLKLVKAL